MRSFHHAVFWILLVSLFPDREAAADVPIRGQVAGEATSEVRITLEPLLNRYQRARLRFLGEAGPPAVAATTCDREGYFQLSSPAAGMWKVVVEAGGQVRMEYPLEPLVEATVLPTLELEPACDLEIRVVDPEGQPRKALVAAYARGRQRQAGWRAGVRLARTSDEGVAHLARKRSEPLRVEALASGFPLASIDVPEDAGEPVELQLAPGTAATVVVADTRGQPMAGAVAFHRRGRLPLALADAQGRLELVIPASSPSSIWCLSPTGQSGSLQPYQILSPDQEPVGERILPPRTLRGQVVDLLSRDPVPGALVWVSGGYFTATDDDGNYRLEIPASEGQVQVTASGYGMAGEGRGVETGGSSSSPIFALPPAAQVNGWVVDAAGRPIAGVEVSASSPVQIQPLVWTTGFDQQPAGWRTRSGRHGHFELSGLMAEAGYGLVFTKEGYAPERLTVGPLKPFETRSGLRVVLAAGRLGVGRVVAARAAPVAGAEVTLRRQPPAEPVQARYYQWLADRAPTYLTDSQGRFAIPDLGAGLYDLTVRAAGYGPTTVRGLRVDDGSGEIDLGTAVLEPGAAIAGQVTDPQGKPIAAARILAQPADPGPTFGLPTSAEVTSDENGRFALVDLRPGQRMRLDVDKDGYVTVTLPAVEPPSAKPLEIVLRPTARLSGRVLDSAGHPIGDALVKAEAETPPRVFDATDAEGRFLLEGFQPGKVTVSVEAPTHQDPPPLELEVPAGRELSGIEIRLEPGATIEGTVRGADGEPVHQAAVRVAQRRDGFSEYLSAMRLTDQAWSERTRTDLQGRFRISGIPPGPVWVSAELGQHRQVWKKLELDAGLHALDLVFAAGFQVAGRVIDVAGGPIAGAFLSLTPSAPSPRPDFSFQRHEVQVTTAGDGTFAFADVEPGSYLVKAHKEGFAPTTIEAPIEVADGDVTGLEIRLRPGATLSGRILGLTSDELATVRIDLYSPGSGRRRPQVDSDGRYAVAALSPGRWSVHASIPGTNRKVSRRVVVAADQTAVELDLEFRPGWTLTGVALDGDKPIAGARIRAEANDSDGDAVTDAEGRFRIEDLPAGSYEVTLRTSSSEIWGQVVAQVDLSSDQDVRIEIFTSRISGTIRDRRDKRPIPGATIGLQRHDVEGLSLRELTPGGNAESDDQGRFLVPQVRPGVWRLIVVKSGYGPVETILEVRDGMVVEGLDFEMAATEAVWFEAVLASGAAAQRVNLAILDSGGRRLHMSFLDASEDGRFRVSMAPVGSWLLIQGLIAESGDLTASAITRVAVTEPGDLGRVELPLGGSLFITVAELEGDSQPARVTFTAPDGTPHWNILSFGPKAGDSLVMGGRAVVGGLRPGVWNFTVTHPDGRTWTGSATVTPGAMVQVTVP